MINIIFAFLQLSSAAAPEFCTSKNVEKQSKAEKRISRNTIYAKHGRPFSSEDLKLHFYGGDAPKYQENSNYSDNLLSSQDLNCIQRIKIWEQGSPTWTGTLDLDGDGSKEKAYLFDFRPEFIEENAKDIAEDCYGQKNCAVIVMIADEIFTIPMGRKKNTYFGKIKISNVNINKMDTKEELHLQYHAGMYGEDPPKTNIFFYSQHGRVQQTTISAEGYSSGTVTLKGDGLIQKSEMEWINNEKGCVTNHLTISYAIEGKEQSRKITKTDEFCAACPYVEVWNNEQQEWQEKGEILRHLNSQEKKDWNSLKLQYSSDILKIRLSERKPEITYLDALQLKTTDGIVLPESCYMRQREMIYDTSWCHADDENYILEEGDEQEFIFQLPYTEKPRTVILEGFGYYEPLR